MTEVICEYRMLFSAAMTCSQQSIAIKLTAQTPLADVRVYSGSSTESFGGRTTITTRLNSYESYLKFDVSTLSGSVKLQLFGNINSSGTNVTVGVYPTDSNWTETGL